MKTRVGDTVLYIVPGSLATRPAIVMGFYFAKDASGTRFEADLHVFTLAEDVAFLASPRVERAPYADEGTAPAAGTWRERDE